jgi:hypothetical protein
MSYITGVSTQLILGKLTQYGREMLSKGLLTFSSWSIGDSEINYNVKEPLNQFNLSPRDNNPTFIDYIQSGGNNLIVLNSGNIITSKIKQIKRRENLNTISGTPVQWDENVNWDSDIMQFNPSCNFNENGITWKKQNIYTKSIFGVSGHTEDTYFSYENSAKYLGQKNILFNDITETNEVTFDPCNIVTDNSYINNSGFTVIYLPYDKVFDYYGEELYVDETNPFEIELPTIDYHRYLDDEPCKFISDDKVNYLDSNQTPYYNLLEDKTKTIDGKSEIVGRIYPTLLLCVLTDSELVFAMESKSNRNYTLPKLNAITEITNKSEDVFINPKEVVYLTYVVNGTIHCQYITKVINNTSLPKKLSLSLTNKIKDSVGDVDNIAIIYQVVDDLNDNYNMNDWKVIDITDIFEEGNFVKTFGSETKSNSSKYVLGVDISDKKLGLSNDLSAIISTSYSTSIFKSKFNLNIDSNSFNNSTNYSYSYNDVITDDGSDLKVSEVGIYDNNNKMVICGKLSTPFEIKENTTTNMVLTIDF